MVDKCRFVVALAFATAVVMVAASPAAARAYCNAKVCVSSECHNLCEEQHIKANAVGGCSAVADLWLPEAGGHAKATRSNWWFGHKTATEAWPWLGAGCNPKTAYAKAWFSTGTYRVTGPEGTTAELRVIVRETGVAQLPEGHGDPPAGMPSQGAFADHDMMLSWTTDIAITQGSITTTAFTGSGTVGGPDHSAPGLFVSGDYVGAWYESCTMLRCDGYIYEPFYGIATVTVNANEVFDLTHDESLTAEHEEPIDVDGMVEGAASFIVDLELVDQSGTYQLEYVDEEPICGDGTVDPGEECDGGTGCTDCVCDFGFEPTAPPSLNCQPICGNGSLDPGEECDGAAGTCPGGAACRSDCTCPPPPATGACCADVSGVCRNDVTQAACEGSGRRYGGDGTDCGTIDPPCQPSPGLPAVSTWGLLALVLSLLIGLAITFGRRKSLRA